MPTLDAYGATDVGRVRAHNEDAFFADAGLGIFVVADGMGGHAGGALASKLAIETVSVEIEAHRKVFADLDRTSSQLGRASAAAVIEGAVQRACAEIYNAAQAKPHMAGMGTTVVCMVAHGTKAVVGHVGDSRVYLVRNGQSHRLTEDHSVVGAQLKAGAITAEQAAASRYRNVVTRAVGIQQTVQVDTLNVDLVPGDRYLLCSDGLHAYITDSEIASLLSSRVLSELPGRLISLANERGGQDNITAIVIDYSSEHPEAVAETADANSRMAALQHVPLFRYLSSKEQLAVLATTSTRNYESGAKIVVEESPGDAMFVVIQGRVCVETKGVEIARLDSGGHFGEMGLINDLPRSATVRALEPCRMMVINRPDLVELMKEDRVLSIKLLWNFVNVLSERLHTTSDELSFAKQEIQSLEGKWSDNDG